MSSAHRAVLLIGMFALVVAGYRALMPFSAATTPTGRDHVQCGVAAVEAAHGADVTTVVFKPNLAGPSGTTSSDPLGSFIGVNYTYHTLSTCTAAARHRVTGAGVLAGLAVVGTAGGLLVVRQPRAQPAAA